MRGGQLEPDQHSGEQRYKEVEEWWTALKTVSSAGFLISVYTVECWSQFLAVAFAIGTWNCPLALNSNASSKTFESSSLSLSLILDNKFRRLVTTYAFIIYPNSGRWSHAQLVLSFLCLSF